MNLKPLACRGCPAFGDSHGFVPDQMVEGAEVLFMFQGPGENEEKGLRVVDRGPDGQHVTEPYPPTPLIGITGLDFNTRYLPLAGLSRERVSVGNVMRCRWEFKGKKSNKLPNPKLVEKAIEHCAVYFKPPVSTRLVVAAGNPAKWALTGKGTVMSGIEDWRGWMAPFRPPYQYGQATDTTIYLPGPSDVPVLMTLHLADMYRDPMAKIPTKADYQKIRRILDGKWPRAIPTPQQMGSPEMWVNGIAFDTEYNPTWGMKELHRYNVFTPTGGLWVVEAANHQRELVPDHPIDLIGQNFCTADDLTHARALGIQLGRLDDIMLLHAALWPGLPHDLDFLASIYGRTNRWKHLVHTNPLEYAAGDPVGTMDVWRGLRAEADRAPATWRIYNRYMRPNIQTINKRRVKGLKVDQARAKDLAGSLEAELTQVMLQAQGTVGWPINLGSAQHVAWTLYRDLAFRAPRGRRPR